MNPFAGYGTIVHGKRFVGRKKKISQIKEYVLGEEHSCIAIMGLPRIGKSSLAWQAIKENEEVLNKEKTFVLFLPVATIDKSQGSSYFFKAMVNVCNDELDIKSEDVRYAKIKEKFVFPLKTETDDEEIRSLVLKYFKFIREFLKYKIIFILDEFDHVMNFFKTADFQLLREMAYDPQYKVCLVTVSRKSIQEIEAVDGGISNFYGIFSDIRLGMFDDEDMQDYWHRVIEDFNPNEDLKKQIYYYVGTHPLLLDVLCDWCYRNKIQNEEELDNHIRDIYLTLENHFNTACHTLQNENLLDKAAQFVLGPVIDVTESDKERLLKFSFISPIKTQKKREYLGEHLGYSFGKKISDCIGEWGYVCISPYFTQFFQSYKLNGGDFWNLWQKTENEMRNLVKTRLISEFGEEWQQKFPETISNIEARSKWISDFTELKDFSKKKLLANPHASSNPVDYSYFMGLWSLFITKDKDFYRNVFLDEWKDLGKSFEFLNQIRNYYAHNNNQYLSDEDNRQAIIICKKILEAINRWHDSQLD